LRFPAGRVLIHRTRLAYIHLDNLLHFAKIDRDGRVDAFIVAYLPNEAAVVFFQGGEAVTAVALTQHGRETIPVGEAVQAMKDEVERSELFYAEAPAELLLWMYCAGSMPLEMIPVDQREPARVFETLQQDRVSGVVEFIVDGRVNYLHLKDGHFASGYFAEKPDAVPVSSWLEEILKPHEDGSRPTVVAGLFRPSEALPIQAPGPLLEAVREVFWRLAEHAEQEAPQDGLKRALRLRDAVAGEHPTLAALTVDRGEPLRVGVVTPEEVTSGLAAWARQLLEQLEIVAPGSAPEVLRGAAKDYRYLLQGAGFFGQLPWTVTW
jgi:hypothetical protein